uniref:Uncharacterized protein n=1 Tax=Penaeus monodon majanivirus A TaxID=2984271 RepID=A0A9C7F7G1_9VIRU|nr:MAG: hypothetical protein [Penaeus monodon majanivirus A]
MSGGENRNENKKNRILLKDDGDDDYDFQAEDSSLVQMYDKFCIGCIGKFRNVILSKLESPKHAPLHNVTVDNAVVRYLKNNSLSIVERIEEEFVDNESCDDNELRNNPLGCIPLKRTLNVLEVLNNRNILNLTNLSDHILLKGSLKGVVMEIDDPHRGNKTDTEENISMTFDEALLKCIPRDISCNCTDNGSRESRDIIEYGKNDNVDRSKAEYAENEWHVSTDDDIGGNDDNDDSNNDNNEDDKDNGSDEGALLGRNDRSRNTVYSEIPNSRKCNNTVTLLGNNEKYLCLEICKHVQNCPVDVNNMRIIDRNINLSVREPNTNTNTEVELEITNNGDSSVNTGNMVYVSGSTVCRGEIFMKEEEGANKNHRAHNKDTLERIFMLMNKNENVTQRHISDLVNELDHAKRISQSFTICNLTYVAPVVSKSFKDQIMNEFNNAYGRSVTTLHLGPLSRGNIYDETKIWMRKYMQHVAEKNVEINCGDLRQSTILVDVPLFDNKTKHGTHVSLSNLCGKNALLTNMRMVQRLITIIDFIASDIRDTVYNRELLKSNTKLQATEPVNHISQGSASSSSSSSSSSVTSVNTTINDVSDIRYKMLVKDYSLCLHIRRTLQETHRYLNEIYMETA